MKKKRQMVQIIGLAAYRLFNDLRHRLLGEVLLPGEMKKKTHGTPRSGPDSCLVTMTMGLTFFWICSFRSGETRKTSCSLIPM